MQTFRITFWDLVLIGIGVGIVLGLIPLILGFVKNRRNLGVYGFIASIIGGSLSSFFSLIVVGVFVWLILKKPAEAPAVNENSVKTEISPDNNI